MKWNRVLFRVIASAVFCFAPTLLAQFSGSLQGSVQDSGGASVPNASITLANSDTHVEQTTVSDASGVFRFASLAPGNYQITVSASGFSKKSVSLVLETGETRNVPVTLSVGGANTTVSVTTDAALLDTSDSRNQQTLGVQALNSLPLSTRNPTQLVTLAPGVTGIGSGTATNFNPENYVDASANGRGQNGNQYIVDGLDVTSNIRPGVLNLTPSADTISELNIQTNTYSVDYGRASSLQVVMTTKSGTGEYHGFASNYYTYQGLWAKGEFTHPSPGSPTYAPFHTNNMSFGVGGPVIPKHQFFFFFGIEPYRAITSNGLSLQTYEDPAFVSFARTAAPNAPEVQLLKTYPPSNATFVKVASTAQDVLGAQNPIDTGGPAVRPAFATTSLYYGAAIQINETHTFTPKTLNEAIFARNRIEGYANATGNFAVPIVNVSGLGVGFGDGFAQGDYIQHSYHWRDVLTHIRGSHQFEFGYEGWHGADVAIFQGAYGQPTFQFNNIIDLLNDNPYSETGLSYNIVSGKPQPGNYYFGMTIGGAFAQDSWKVNRKLTLNYGLRYDNNGNAYPIQDGILANFHRGTGSTLNDQVANGFMQAQSHTLNHDMNWIFSPRLGFAYDPTGHGNWVVHGGFGLFHDLFTQGNAENSLRGNPPYWTIPTFYNNGSTAKPIFSSGTQNTFPYGFTYPAFQGQALDAKGGIVGSQISVGGVDVNLSSPNTLNWSVAVERQLTPKLVASLGYVGSHSDNLVTGGGNTGSTSYGLDVNAFNGDLLQHPNFANDGTYTGTGTQTRLNTSFGALTYATNGPRANYNAFIAAVKGRFLERGFITASYTLGNSKDDWYYYPGSAWQNYYAPSPWDVRNRLSVGATYDLPGVQSHGSFVSRATSGWVLSGTVVLQGGVPFTVYTGQSLSINPIASDGQKLTQANYAAELAAGNLQYNPGSGDFNADGNNFDYPNVSSYKTKNSRSDFIAGLFPHCAGSNLNNCGPFSLPTFGQEGNEQQNQFRNPGFAETDASLHKVTKIKERLDLDVRVDAFNLFNRVNLGGADTNAQDGNFGQSTGLSANPRNFQGAIKLSF